MAGTLCAGTTDDQIRRRLEAGHLRHLDAVDPQGAEARHMDAIERAAESDA